MNYQPEGAIVLDGLEDAIIGQTTRNGENVLAYSADKIIDILVKREEMEYQEALEYYDFNVKGVCEGKRMPVLIWELEINENEKIN